MLTGFLDSFEIIAKVLDVLERPSSFSVKQLQTMFDICMTPFPREKELKEQETRKLRNMIVSHSVKSLNKHDKDAGTARYSSTKELLWKYMDANSEWAWSANQRTVLNVWIAWIGALLRLNSAKEEEVWIPTLRGSFLVTGMDCLQQWGHKNFEVVAPVRKPSFSTLVVGKEGSSFWACSRFHAFVYYPAGMTKWRAHCIWERK